MATQYAAGLDAVEKSFDKQEYRKAASTLDEVEKLTRDYGSLDPVPSEIAEVVPRHRELKTKVDGAVAVLDAATNLDKNIETATEMTEGTKDGETWKSAKAFWEAALANVVTLEEAGEHLADAVPDGLSKKRKTIERQLKKAEKIVSKYDQEQAELAIYLELCGDPPAGCGGGWDGACIGTEPAFKKVAHDPSDVDVEGCTQPVMTTDDCWHSTCTVLARNGFGARVRQRYVFRFSKLGTEVVGEAN